MSNQIPPNLLKSLQIALEELKTIIEEQNKAAINAINYFESLLGIKPAAVAPPPERLPPVTITTPQGRIEVTSPFASVLGLIYEEGIKLRPYRELLPIALTGQNGITKTGNSYDIGRYTDYIIVSPSVETRISFDKPVDDTIPPTPAGGKLAGTIKVRKIYYKATAAVPDTSLPGELDIFALFY